ncbi:hypothetical protein MHYP_G00053620 [Metynnis hypsauchen]
MPPRPEPLRAAHTQRRSEFIRSTEHPSGRAARRMIYRSRAERSLLRDAKSSGRSSSASGKFKNLPERSGAGCTASSCFLPPPVGWCCLTERAWRHSPSARLPPSHKPTAVDHNHSAPLHAHPLGALDQQSIPDVHRELRSCILVELMGLFTDELQNTGDFHAFQFEHAIRRIM